MTISLNLIFRTLIIIWIVGVSGYFFYDLYQEARYGLYQSGVTQGYTSTVNELITKVSGKCDTATVVNIGDKKVEIIDVTCLKTQPPVQSSATGSLQPRMQSPNPGTSPISPNPTLPNIK